MVGCCFARLSYLSVFSFQDQGQRSTCSRDKKQTFKARGWGWWGEGVKGHLRPLLACDICHSRILFVKAGHMVKTTVMAWGRVLGLQGRHCKVTWKRACGANPNCQWTTMVIPFLLASEQFRSAECYNSGQWDWRGSFLGVLRKKMCVWGNTVHWEVTNVSPDAWGCVRYCHGNWALQTEQVSLIALVKCC